MSTLSVPLTPELEIRINSVIELGISSSKADLARTALEKYLEDLAVLAVLQSEQEVKEGKILQGDLDQLSQII